MPETVGVPIIEATAASRLVASKDICATFRSYASGAFAILQKFMKFELYLFLTNMLKVRYELIELKLSQFLLRWAGIAGQFDKGFN